MGKSREGEGDTEREGVEFYIYTSSVLTELWQSFHPAQSYISSWLFLALVWYRLIWLSWVILLLIINYFYFYFFRCIFSAKSCFRSFKELITTR